MVGDLLTFFLCVYHMPHDLDVGLFPLTQLKTIQPRSPQEKGLWPPLAGGLSGPIRYLSWRLGCLIFTGCNS